MVIATARRERMERTHLRITWCPLVLEINSLSHIRSCIFTFKIH